MCVAQPKAWPERIQDVCGSAQVSWDGRFLLPARHRQDRGAWRAMGLSLRSLRGSGGNPGHLCAAPTPAGYESAHSWAQQRPHCDGVSSLRSKTAVYFSCSKGEGRGGLEELTLLVLTLAQDPWKALEGKRLKEQTLEQGGGGLRASLPHSWGSQPKPVPQASSWSGMLGFPRSGKYWQGSFHDVTAWSGPARALSPPGRDVVCPGGTQSCLEEVL